jgi:hypothetical protein
MKNPNPLAGTHAPTAPLRLRSQVLASMRSCPPTESQGPWERIWGSRRLRLAWLITVLVLLALNLAPSPFGSRVSSDRAASRVQSRPNSELASLGLSGPILWRLEASTRGRTLGDQLELLETLRGEQ